jgi:hypothetical protein
MPGYLAVDTYDDATVVVLASVYNQVHDRHTFDDVLPAWMSKHMCYRCLACFARIQIPIAITTATGTLTAMMSFRI